MKPRQRGGKSGGIGGKSGGKSGGGDPLERFLASLQSSFIKHTWRVLNLPNLIPLAFSVYY